MDNETDPDKPPPGSEGNAVETPMHYLFEIELISNEIAGLASEEHRISFDRKVKKQHVRKYLLDYYRKHAVLPMGRHHLGMTRPGNVEIGMVDLGAIRSKIRAGSEKSKVTDSASLAFVEAGSDYPSDGESETGMRRQPEGRDANSTILDLRRKRAGRSKKPGRRG